MSEIRNVRGTRRMGDVATKGERRTGLMILCALALVQCVARFALPAMILAGGGPTFDGPVSGQVAALVLWMFVIIGTFGLVATYGLWTGRRWGYNGTILLSLATIAFDLWAVAMIQSSAALGLVLPAAFIVYLLLIRKDFATGAAV